MGEMLSFERIYVPPVHDDNDAEKKTKLIKVALTKGFKYPEYDGMNQEELIQTLTNKKNYAIVLQKVGEELTISDKVMSQVLPHLADKDVKNYSPETAIEWIKENTKNKQ